MQASKSASDLFNSTSVPLFDLEPESLLHRLHERVYTLFEAAKAYDSQVSRSAGPSPKRGSRLGRSLSSIGRRKSSSDFSPSPLTLLSQARNAVQDLGMQLRQIRSEQRELFKPISERYKEFSEATSAMDTERQRKDRVAREAASSPEELDELARSATWLRADKTCFELLSNYHYEELQLVCRLPLVCALNWACDPTALPEDPKELRNFLLHSPGPVAWKPVAQLFSRFEDQKKLFLSPLEIEASQNQHEADAKDWAAKEVERRISQATGRLAERRLELELELKQVCLLKASQDYSPRSETSSDEQL